MKYTYIKLVMVMLFWGAAFVTGRILAQAYHPFTISFLRFFTASLVMVPLLFLRYKCPFRLSFKQWLSVALLGLTGVFSYNYFFFTGLKLVEAGKSSVIISMNPAVSALFATLLLKEELSLKKTCGVFIALLGVLIVVTNGDFLAAFNLGFGNGEISLFLAVLSWASYTVLGRATVKKLDAFHANTIAILIGTIALLPFAYSNGLISTVSNASIMEWLHILNLGILCTSFGFVWYIEGVENIGVTQASSFINLVPIFGISSGIFFLNESVDISLAIGSLIIITGIYIINKPKLLSS